ncbi:hypothetical protein [Bradyrhizobium sp. CCBAU 65884]|uniref:hypothetical protein n=1 Tax=Bradyrhizobium sp. CCBAU 65884 TaxID=722477 RepID=UPI00230587D1|nr:hypothetical protein [Bradyrhizobium sp. CCBAU 65884]
MRALANTRGNFAAAISPLLTYLLTGRQDKLKCFKPWGLFEKGLADVTAKASLVTPSRKDRSRRSPRLRRSSHRFLKGLFALRDSPGWNVPDDILASEAAPRVLKILDLLDGPSAGEGTRSGGNNTAQMAHLADGAHQVEARLSLLRVTLWGLLVAGVALGIIIASRARHSNSHSGNDSRDGQASG